MNSLSSDRRLLERVSTLMQWFGVNKPEITWVTINRNDYSSLLERVRSDKADHLSVALLSGETLSYQGYELRPPLDRDSGDLFAHANL